MRKQFLFIAIGFLIITLSACNNDAKKETEKDSTKKTEVTTKEDESSRPSAQSIAQKWCDLNAKISKATNEEERAKAEQEKADYEKMTEEQYKSDAAFVKEIERAVEACEGQSEQK